VPRARPFLTHSRPVPGDARVATAPLSRRVGNLPASTKEAAVSFLVEVRTLVSGVLAHRMRCRNRQASPDSEKRRVDPFLTEHRLPQTGSRAHAKPQHRHKRFAEVACARRSDERRLVGGKATGRQKTSPAARRPATGNGRHEGLATSQEKAPRIAGAAGLSRGTAAKRSWRSSMERAGAKAQRAVRGATGVSEAWRVNPERGRERPLRAFTGPPKRSAAS